MTVNYQQHVSRRSNFCTTVGSSTARNSIAFSGVTSVIAPGTLMGSSEKSMMGSGGNGNGSVGTNCGGRLAVHEMRRFVYII